MTTPGIALCRSRSKYGKCGRPLDHEDEHAVPIGVDCWFGYTRSGSLGYGFYRGGTFVVTHPSKSKHKAVAE